MTISKEKKSKTVIKSLTYNQSCRVHIFVLYEKLSYVLGPQGVFSHKLGENSSGFAIFAGHNWCQIWPTGVQIERLLCSYSGSWNTGNTMPLSEILNTMTTKLFDRDISWVQRLRSQGGCRPFTEQKPSVTFCIMGATVPHNQSPGHTVMCVSIHMIK